ncbi:hypothetical protein SSABA_v1c01700 [Spiroplasma sabaudiense Ar-1343]|uniref:Transmembrane protein n=1 Tax=Spiroplasma sabaudiense Ar-1343 TaxID=1276257 RepID=W6A984_9MOLU|nr:hypothetical protein [Spiroplasma sabaudiense]AHI53582.1 hypothetical protein SSABA_v1c01700 [Spiroplasma sabaudiense Ar-1343]
MKNKAIPGIILSLEIGILIIIATIIFTNSIAEDQKLLAYSILGVEFAVICCLIILYFLRNFLSYCPKWIDRFYNIFFINVGTFYISKSYFLIGIFVFGGIIILITNLISLNMTLMLISNLKINLWNPLVFIGLINLIVLVAYLIAVISILILLKFSKDFYRWARYFCLLLPLLGWAYFFTFQKAKRNEGFFD